MEQDVVRSAVLSADDFALTLSALQQLDGVRVVSNPKMLVANGQTANIHVGRNEPNVRAVPQGENANTFAYVLDGFIEIGVKLEVTPIINTSKNITINIVPELSRLLGEKTVGEAGTSFPITQIRRIETEFAVESGKTVAIGGLTQSDENEEVTKVPLLGDIPIIGKYLFSHTSTRMIQDEIIIFVSVDTAHTEKLNDRDGIPNEGSLIHTWLDYQERDEAPPLRRGQ
jgi:type II secretory pathway component GspD/PulD (secretin)